MARPRRPFSGVTVIQPAADAYYEGVYPGHLGTRQRTRWLSDRNLHYTQSCSHEDSLSLLLLLDALMNIDSAIELRAKPFSDWLNNHYPSLFWNAPTVGRILSDLCMQFEFVLGEKSGLLEESRDSRGAFYLIHENPETAALAYAVREDLRSLALQAVDLSRTFSKSDPRRRLHEISGSPLNECPSLQKEIVV